MPLPLALFFSSSSLGGLAPNEENEKNKGNGNGNAHAHANFDWYFLTLFFKINDKADLLVKCLDIKDEFIGEYNLGNIF